MTKYKAIFSAAVLLISCAVSANPFIKDQKVPTPQSDNLLGAFFGEMTQADQTPNEKKATSEQAAVPEEAGKKEAIPVSAKESQAVVQNKEEDLERKDMEPQPQRQSKITSKKTFYDRREGIAYFEGDVFVDDAQYKLHADRVYVFLDGTNELRRIVAVGNVAMTNGLKRAYAEKASYYKRNGMVVLASGENTPAEVYDDSKGASQSVKGSKIRFWTSADQVEVIDAAISAPTGGGIKGGLGNLKDALGK